MGPEAKLYQKLKKNFIGFSLIRLENLSLLGTPDLLVYNNNRHFFTIELKVTKSKKVRFSPHQIAFHLRHPTISMYRGSRIRELAACGLKLDACSLGLDACRLMLEELGA
jgi:hypothetical protein